jgi:hypothetical protein
MAIYIEPAPEEGAQIVQRYLAQPRSAETMMAANAAANAEWPPWIPIRMSYPVYSADLDDVLDRKRRLLKRAELTSWQYILGTDDKVLALAEVAAGMPMEYASKQPADFAEAVLAAVARAAKVENVRMSNYELRLLRVPELYLFTVWLHGEKDDILLPIRPFNRALEELDRETFSERQVVDALRPIAEVRAATRDE